MCGWCNILVLSAEVWRFLSLRCLPPSKYSESERNFLCGAHSPKKQKTEQHIILETVSHLVWIILKSHSITHLERTNTSKTLFHFNSMCVLDILNLYYRAHSWSEDRIWTQDASVPLYHYALNPYTSSAPCQYDQKPCFQTLWLSGVTANKGKVTERVQISLSC